MRASSIACLTAGFAALAVLAMAQDASTPTANLPDASPLVDGRPGATVLATPGPDAIEPIYAFPPNCLPIIGLRNSGINRLLANVSNEDLRVVVLAELSGNSADLAKAWRDGIQLAVDIANNKGGIMGRRIVVETRDVGTDSPGVAAVVEDVLKQPPFAIFGPLNEGAAKTAVDSARRSQTPMILGTAGLDLQSQPEAWLTRGQPTQLSRLLQLADHAREEYKARSAALIWSDTDYGRSRRDILKGAFVRRSLQLAVDSGVTPGQKDFADILARVRARNPDVLFLMVHSGDAVRLLAALRRQGFNKPILVDGDVVDRAFLDAAGQNANGLRGIVGLYADAPIARVRMMADRFSDRFGYRPPVPGVNGFVAFNALKASVEQACSFNGTDLFKAWRNLKIDASDTPGILMDSRIDWAGNFLRDEFVFEIRNGVPSVINLQHPLGTYN
jgi:branched-chain amino acid transport system substrate-binding protein